MTVTIDLPPKTERRLSEHARGLGQNVEDIVIEAIERMLDREHRSFAEILEPVAKSVQKSGMTEKEIEAIVDEEIRKHRAGM